MDLGSEPLIFILELIIIILFTGGVSYAHGSSTNFFYARPPTTLPRCLIKADVI